MIQEPHDESNHTAHRDARVNDRIEDRQSAADVSTADAQYHRIEHGE